MRARDVGKIEKNPMTSLVPGTKLCQKLPKGAWHLLATFLIFVKNKNMIYLKKCFKWEDDGYKYINQEVSAA
ncbi:MAG TPA: hypothetical protein DHW70_04225, partial [Candidatus Atribacteria bacterium]|nr:hypothetical protein [Candidatus Atribacteria bacterium]